MIGTAPNRALEIDWVTENLTSGGGRLRLRFEEVSSAFVVHYGPIVDDGFPEAWTQLAMLTPLRGAASRSGANVGEG